MIPGDYQYKALNEGNRIQRFWHKNKIKLLFSILTPNKRDLILDAGCGSGNHIRALKKSCNIVGLDISLNSLKFVHKSNKDEDTFLINATLTQLPLKKNIFDKVLLLDVIEHFREEEVLSVIEELKNTLKPGGKLFLTTPNYNSIWPFVEFIADTLRLTPRMRDEQHLTKFTPDKIKKLLNEKKFDIEKTGTIYGPSFLYSHFSERLANKQLEKELHGKSMLGQLVYAVGIKKKLSGIDARLMGT